MKKGVFPLDKSFLKKEGEELQEFLKFKRRHSIVEAQKGKGAKYKRSREKDKARKQEME